MTKLEIYERMDSPVGLCPCGANEIRSCNFKWWEELFLLRSWKMFFAIRRGELAPPPPAGEVKAMRDALIRGIAAIEENDPELEAYKASPEKLSPPVEFIE